MPGLVLKLPPRERLIVNGAVIENGDRTTRLRVLTPDTQLLRLRDAVDPNAPATPVGRLAHIAQTLLVGERDPLSTLPETLSALDTLRLAFTAATDLDLIDAIHADLQAHRFYRALRNLGRLRAREAQLLGTHPA